MNEVEVLEQRVLADAKSRFEQGDYDGAIQVLQRAEEAR